MESIMEEVEKTITGAIQYAHDLLLPDGNWCGEMRSNATMTAEYVFLCQMIGLDLTGDDAYELRRSLLYDQNPNGSWSLGYGLPGDISTTVEACLALKILGMSSDAPAMIAARDFAIQAGGVARVRVFTRIYLAMFGLFPWTAIPQLPPEIIFLPASSPFSIYRLSSWARATLIPLIVNVHHEPLFALPNGTSGRNDFLDELWVHPKDKNVPYGPSLYSLARNEGIFTHSFGFTLADKACSYMKSILKLPLLHNVRDTAIRKCVEWTLERYEETGDIGGIQPPMCNGALMLVLQGYSLDSTPVKRALGAINRFLWKGRSGIRLQACVSHTWDTILMSTAFLDCGMDGTEPVLQRSTDWILQRQRRGIEGDWRIYRPSLSPGGWAFEEFNTWYPDIDDSAAAIIALIKQNSENCNSPHVLRAINWILGMQNKDGGWGAFDVDNDKLYLNRIPFNDMEALCDPSTADVTGHVIEALALVCSKKTYMVGHQWEKEVQLAIFRAIQFLASIQEPDGSWYGRWGVNYVYGTSSVLCAFAYADGGRTKSLVKPAIQWLKDCQRLDGGWGESLATYPKPRILGAADAESTPSQTAWALMALLAHLPATDEAIARGIQFLISQRVEDKQSGTVFWEEPQYTGTGFPGHFYLHYDFYRHYFPMMALGRYRRSLMRGVASVS